MSGILTIFSREAYIFIDLGSTHSFISCTFSIYMDKEMKPLDCTLVVATLVGNSLLAGSVFRDCIVRVCDKDMVAYLIPLNIHDFNAILGMDWLANHYATMDCFRKEVTFRKFGESEIIFYGE